MVKHIQPSKETVREWLRAEIARRAPPPDPGQIRRALGWDAGLQVQPIVVQKPRRSTAR